MDLLKVLMMHIEGHVHQRKVLILILLYLYITYLLNLFIKLVYIYNIYIKGMYIGSSIRIGFGVNQ